MGVIDTPARMPVLLGGRVALDFTNTVEGREGPRRDERLTGYEDLVRWSRHAGVLPDEQGLLLLESVADRPDVAADVFEQTLTFREALYRVFVAVAHERQPDREAFDVLGWQYERTVAHGRLVERDGSAAFDWTWRDDIVELDRPLWPIALDAVDLLRSEQLARVKQCANVEGCGWLFLDTSKNGSRRWCSMAACGSRIKMRRQYAKRRAATSS